MPLKLAPRLNGFDYVGFYQYFLTGTDSLPGASPNRREWDFPRCTSPGIDDGDRAGIVVLGADLTGGPKGPPLRSLVKEGVDAFLSKRKSQWTGN
jgi:hypothetical protein